MADIEMDIKEGDIISIIQEHDSGWWQVASRERARAREEERGRESERASERDRERKRQRERQRERQTERATSSTSFTKTSLAGGRFGVRLQVLGLRVRGSGV